MSQSERVAILVIHGIGNEEPYGTIDQFARGLHASLESSLAGAKQTWAIQPNLDRVQDPTHAEKSWVRAFYRFVPQEPAPAPFQSDKSNTIESVTLYEYYWAPITKDQVAYTTSLMFLIKAGLQPFRYMAANINAISSVSSGRKQAWEIAKVAGHEILRQLCFFVPLLALLTAALIWLGGGQAIHDLKNLSQDMPAILGLALFSLRLLFLYTGATAFLGSFGVSRGWQRSWLWRAWLILMLVFNLWFWPYLFPNCLQAFGHWLAGIDTWPSSHSPFPAAGEHIATFVRGFTPTDARLPNTFIQFVLLRPSLICYSKPLLSLGLAYVVRSILITYIGDLAVYCNPNRLSKNYAAKAQVLDECTAALSAILLETDRQGAPMYQRVLIAAHSLGSVIAYDSLNQLLNLGRISTGTSGTLQPTDLERVNGLLTFGCPLNKIFYFFRELDDPKATLRRQTLDLMHGFRLKKVLTDNLPDPHFDRSHDPAAWTDSIGALAANFTWINAYAPFDPISGKLIFYDLGKTDATGKPVGDPDDSQQSFPLAIPFVAHNMYWNNQKFYAFFRQHLL